ncbi:hypothetical protein A4R43_01460 [Amycolatopsis albispora]|uniref:OmpA-like domain-containing protein n=2 Tax=Amycolatopsis albispora TaxID=1804986 RepID=A0A344KZX6_9PSEU|nr:hypothetical protein A4R43_01460 [Amycolatopsis albispora]
MRRKIALTVAGAAMVAGLAGACGSEDSSGSSGANDAASPSGAAAPSPGAGDAPAPAPGEGDPAQAQGGPAQQVTTAIEQALQKAPVTFTPENAELTAEAKQSLEQIAKAMQGNEVKIKVATHAGYPDAAKAKELSEKRAEAITSAFEGFGVSKDRVQAEATGNEKAQDEQALQTQISVAG